MRLRELEIYTKRVDEGGRKSIPLSELSGEYFFKASHGMYVPSAFLRIKTNRYTLDGTDVIDCTFLVKIRKGDMPAVLVNLDG